MSSTVYDKRLNPYDKDCVVNDIVVTSSGTVSTMSGMPNVFHWRFYLQIEPGQSKNLSVVVDMQPVNPPVAMMIISSKEGKQSMASNKIELNISTRGSPTVNQIIGVFLKHRMHCYRFDDSGAGCLYWTFTGLRILEQYGLVEHGAVEKLEKFHKEQAEAHPERHPMPLRKGVFY